MFGIDFAHHDFDPNWIQSKMAFYLSIGFASLSLLISIIHIVQHLLHYSMPGIQIYVIRILVICPVYAISSSVALGLGDNGAYAEISRDVYEAFVIYSFFNLILEYSGGETDCIYQIENEPQLKWPCPLCFLKPRPRDARLMRFCLRGVLQFVIIKPIVAVMDIIMIATGNKSKLGYEIFVFIVYNISYAWALYCMFVFYQAIKKLIKNFRPILKFASIKAIVFATYYQSLAVQASSMSPENTVRWNDFILCIEMVFFSALLMIAFPTSEFQGGIPDSKFIENVRSVLSVHDVMQDVYHNFIPVYHDYTLQRSETEAPEVVRMKTYLAGNLDSVAIEMSHRYRGRNKRLAFNSLLRGSTPISARLRGSTRPFGRLRTASEHSSDISDPEPYYDEENSIEGYGSSHDSIDDSTDSTMELCASGSEQTQNQNQTRRDLMIPRIMPQFNGQSNPTKPQYLFLNGSNQRDEDTSDEDIESMRMQKKIQSQMRPQSGHRFFPHFDPRSKISKEEEDDEKIDFDKPLNVRTIPMISPLEQDILERRVEAMATHGIGFVVTKRGIEIRSSDYHPTEEEGVMNEGFMSVDDSSHHSKYDRTKATPTTTTSTSPLSHSAHNPAAANLPRLPKKQNYKKKESPEKEKSHPSTTSTTSSSTLSSLSNSQSQSQSLPPKSLPTLPSLPPPQSRGINKIKPPMVEPEPAFNLKNDNENESKVIESENENDVEGWGWGDFVAHTEEFAEFPNHSPDRILHNDHHHQANDPLTSTLTTIVEDPFDDSDELQRISILNKCVGDLVSIVETLNEEEDSSIKLDLPTTTSISRSQSNEKSSDVESPSFVMVEKDKSLERESSNGFDGGVWTIESQGVCERRNEGCENDRNGREMSECQDSKTAIITNVNVERESSLSLSTRLEESSLEDHHSHSSDHSIIVEENEGFVFPNSEEMVGEDEKEEGEDHSFTCHSNLSISSSCGGGDGESETKGDNLVSSNIPNPSL